MLVRQQHSIIMRMVSNKRVSRLLVEAWTAWRVSVQCNRAYIPLCMQSSLTVVLPVALLPGDRRLLLLKQLQM